MNRLFLYSLVFLATLLPAANSYAEDYLLTIKNNQFSPQDLTIPAGKKVKIIIKNTDSTPAEFESSDLSREKIVGANSEITIFLGPLKAGIYNYVDEFHEDTAKGTITVK
jgi:plastocyanin